MFPVYVNATNVHVYTVETPELRIYQGNTPLKHQQKHIALVYIANKIMEEPGSEQLLFAKIALKAMALSFEAEAVKSNNDILENPEDRNKLYRWAHSTLEYARHLHEVSDSINDYSSIEIDTDKNGELLILVQGKPYFIISPSLHEPEALDQKIIDEVCRIRDCQLELINFDETPAQQTFVIEADWHLTDRSRPEYVTADGLHFIFNDISNRPDKQSMCLKIIKDFKIVTELLIKAHKDGLYIDWEQIYVQKIGDKKQYKLVMNRAGESILIEAPALANVPDLVTTAAPWLKARVYNRKYHHYIEADNLLTSFN